LHNRQITNANFKNAQDDARRRILPERLHDARSGPRRTAGQPPAIRLPPCLTDISFASIPRVI
jgi:hypothetical protein